VNASDADRPQLPRRYYRILTASLILGMVGFMFLGVGLGGGAAQMWDDVPWLAYVGLGVCLVAALTYYLAYRRVGHLLAKK
jgi:hypothetical protein